MFGRIKSLMQHFRQRLASSHERARFLQVVSLERDDNPRGWVLLSYSLYPFLLHEEAETPRHHTSHLETTLIADVFLDLGYSVDVIDYTNQSFMPTKDYAFLVDIRWNTERLGSLLNPNCIKISHHDTAHLLFHNTAAQQRLLQLQQRRGATLQSLRYEPTNLAIENADYATVLGNDFTLGTYRYAEKPLFSLPVPTAVTFDWPEQKDFDRVRKSFLWLGSSGMVHKGLDLVLEAFANLPEFELHVCGPVSGEERFEETYFDELYNSDNIHVWGWVDVGGNRFREITDNCIGLVYTSCSEGQAGSVITCMHAGLIPVVSRESGVDVSDDYGELLAESTVAEITRAVRSIAEKPTETLRAMSRRVWEYARATNTAENYTHEFRAIIERILELENSSGH